MAFVLHGARSTHGEHQLNRSYSPKLTPHPSPVRHQTQRQLQLNLEAHSRYVASLILQSNILKSHNSTSQTTPPPPTHASPPATGSPLGPPPGHPQLLPSFLPPPHAVVPNLPPTAQAPPPMGGGVPGVPTCGAGAPFASITIPAMDPASRRGSLTSSMLPGAATIPAMPAPPGPGGVPQLP